MVFTSDTSISISIGYVSTCHKRDRHKDKKNERVRSLLLILIRILSLVGARTSDLKVGVLRAGSIAIVFVSLDKKLYSTVSL